MFCATGLFYPMQYIHINGLQSHEYHFTPSSSASKRSSLIDYTGGMKLLKNSDAIFTAVYRQE